MRNAIFFLALGLAAIVHFTHQLFPRFTSSAPAYEVFHELDPNRYAPPTRPGIWRPESRLEEQGVRSPKHVDRVVRPAAAMSGSSFEKPAPSCGAVQPSTQAFRLRGL